MHRVAIQRMPDACICRRVALAWRSVVLFIGDPVVEQFPARYLFGEVETQNMILRGLRQNYRSLDQITGYEQTC